MTSINTATSATTIPADQNELAETTTEKNIGGWGRQMIEQFLADPRKHLEDSRDKRENRKHIGDGIRQETILFAEKNEKENENGIAPSSTAQAMAAASSETPINTKNTKEAALRQEIDELTSLKS